MRKKILLFIAVLVLILGCTSIAFAESSGKCGDNITWTLSDEGVLTLEGSGQMYNYSIDDEGNNTPPWYRTAYDIKKCIVEDGITSIGACAFYKCKNMSEIVIPDGVQSFGNDSFSYSGITSIYIPKSLKSLCGYNSHAFWECESLKKVYIADLESYLKIEETYFHAAKPFTYGADLYINNEKVTELVIPNGISEIPSGAFHGCSSITKVIIPSSVTKIGSGAFGACKNLREIDAPHMSTSFDTNCVYSESGGVWEGQSKISSDSTEIWWIKLPNAVKYEISYYNAKGKTVTKTISDPSTTTLTLKKSSIQDSWRIVNITWYLDDGISPELESLSSRVDLAFSPAKTTIKKISTKNKKISVSWKEIEDAKGYEVCISSNKNFKSGTSYTYTVKDKYTCSKSLTKYTKSLKLKAGKKYYVRVRAYSGLEESSQIYYGKWSSTKSITCK